jgi:hypothetical protein
MLTTPHFDSSFAMAAGRQRFALPTFTARRNTTEAMENQEQETGH